MTRPRYREAPTPLSRELPCSECLSLSLSLSLLSLSLSLLFCFSLSLSLSLLLCLISYRCFLLLCRPSLPRQLATHRKSVVEESSSLTQQHTANNHQQPSPKSHSHKNATPSPSLTHSSHAGLTVNGGATTANPITAHSSPRPRRKAPAPPTNHTPLRADHFSSLPRRSKYNMKGSRSREDLVGGSNNQTTLQDFAGLRDRSQTQPQHAMSAVRRVRSGSQPSLVPIQNHTGTAAASSTSRPPSAGKVPSPSSSPLKTRTPHSSPQQSNPSSPQKTHHQQQHNHHQQQGRRRVSEQTGGHGVQRTLSSTSSSSLTVLPSQVRVM